MKKLMFAMAAVAAGTVIADITSNNIVGYAGSELDTNSGSKLLTPQFLDVGADGIALDKLVPKSEGELDWNVEIQVLDNGGETIADQDYMWVDGTWTDPNGDPLKAPVTFKAGQGLCVFSYVGETPVTFQSSGEVSQEDVVVALDTNSGSVITGNAFPVEVALADITPFTEGSDELDWNVEIQVLDNGGETIADQDYMWVGGEWTDPNGDPLKAPVTFAAGQGLCVFCYQSGAQVYLRFPAPEL